MSGDFIIHTGKVEDILPGLPDSYFDAVLCDPPYGLKFMGKKWDHGVPSKEVWEEILRVCKPGAHLLAFGGTRTSHRLTCAIEDAGFEIRDMIAWVYGSGFPKSLDVSKAIDKAAGAERKIIGKSARHVSGKPGQRTAGLVGSKTFEESVGMGAYLTAPATDAAAQWQGYGTALKPALEPITVARKPIEGTVAENVQRHGTGAINVDGCRVGDNPGYKYKADANGTTFHGGQGERIKQTAAKKGAEFIESTQGRWPANLIHDGSEEVVAGLPQSNAGKPSDLPRGKRPGGFGDIGADKGSSVPNGPQYADNGSAARFFYCAKASKSDRGADNNHPTVKPFKLCEYLAKLILPPKRKTPRRILVPFSGSGSEMLGALAAGWDEVWGIEMDEGYVKIAERRLAKWAEE